MLSVEYNLCKRPYLNNSNLKKIDKKFFNRRIIQSFEIGVKYYKRFLGILLWDSKWVDKQKTKIAIQLQRTVFKQRYYRPFEGI